MSMRRTLAAFVNAGTFVLNEVGGRRESTFLADLKTGHTSTRVVGDKNISTGFINAQMAWTAPS